MKTEGLLLTNPICFLPSYEQRRSQGGQFSPFVHCPPAEPSCSSWCVLSPLHTAMVKLMVKVTIPKRNPLRAVWNRKRWRRRSHCIFGSSTPFYQLLWAWQEQHVPKAVNAAFYKCTVVKWGVKTEILGLVPKLSCWTKIAWLYKKKKKIKNTTKKPQSGVRHNKVQNFLMTQKGLQQNILEKVGTAWPHTESWQRPHTLTVPDILPQSLCGTCPITPAQLLVWNSVGILLSRALDIKYSAQGLLSSHFQSNNISYQIHLFYPTKSCCIYFP